MSAPTKLLSIVVPTHNQCKFLHETLVSLKNQTFRNFEIIVVNDASTDDTLQVLREFEALSYLRVISLKSHIGESGAVNIGWRNSHSRFISIVNSDDPQDKEWAEKMMNFIAKNPSFLVYYPDLRIISESSAELGIVRKSEWSRKTVQEQLFCVASAGSVIDISNLKKDFVPRDETIIYPSDLVQFLRLSLYGDFVHVPNVYGTWRNQGQGLSVRLPPKEQITSFNKCIEWWKTEVKNQSLPVNFNNLVLHQLGHSWKILRRQYGIRYSLNSIHIISKTISGFSLKIFVGTPNLLCHYILRKIQLKQISNSSQSRYL